MLASHEAAVRLLVFAAMLLGMGLWEARAPRRPPTVRTARRRASNLGLAALNAGALRLCGPLSAAAAAELCAVRGWGLLHQIAGPPLLEGGGAIVLLDLAVYGQHVAFHATPWLWRIHLVHHADRDLDVTSGLRFHTAEILLSAALKVAAVAALGAAPTAVIAFECLLNATAMFNHGNVRIPPRTDRWLRRLVVTPDMHRVHHSTLRREAHSNFGFNLPWWDLLFGTYRAQPAAGHEGMTLGLVHPRDERVVESLPGMLAMPLVEPGDPSHLAADAS